MSDFPFVEKTINGTEYKCYTLHLAKWAELSELLANFIGGPAASILRGESIENLKEGEASSIFDMVPLIGSIVSKLDAKTIMKVTTIMGNCLHENEKPLGVKKQETWWPNHMADFPLVLGLFIEAQYADFYKGLGGLMPSE